MEAKRKVCKFLAGKAKRKGTIGRASRKWERSIKADLRQT
jgi:hypothetical protein